MEGAKAFYGAVFGWETIDVGGGVEMWTLPGYGDHLEQADPAPTGEDGRVGGPKGFEDVVAAIDPMGTDQPGRRRTGA